MDCVLFHYIEFSGVHRDSLWTQHRLVQYCFSREFTGVHVDSIGTP